jgi:hypothetical protein
MVISILKEISSCPCGNTLFDFLPLLQKKISEYFKIIYMNTKLAQSTPSCSLDERKLCFVAFEIGTEGRLRVWIKETRNSVDMKPPFRSQGKVLHNIHAFFNNTDISSIMNLEFLFKLPPPPSH